MDFSFEIMFDVNYVPAEIRIAQCDRFRGGCIFRIWKKSKYDLGVSNVFVCAPIALQTRTFFASILLYMCSLTHTHIYL